MPTRPRSARLTVSDRTPVPTISGLIRAAADLDTDAVSAAVRTSIASYGVTRSWEWLVSPAWHAVRAVREDVDLAERLFTRAVSQVLVAARNPVDWWPVTTLTACAAHEEHTLPLEAFTAALAEVSASSCLLGARVPSSAVLAAADRLRPTVVVIWSQTGDTADPRQIRMLSTACPAVEVITAGPGWDDVQLPTNTVSAAVNLTLARLSSSATHQRR